MNKNFIREVIFGRFVGYFKISVEGIFGAKRNDVKVFLSSRALEQLIIVLQRKQDG